MSDLSREQIEAWRDNLRASEFSTDYEQRQLDRLCDMALRSIPPASEAVSEEHPVAKVSSAVNGSYGPKVQVEWTGSLPAVGTPLYTRPATAAQIVEQCIAICQKRIDWMYEWPARAGRDVAANYLQGCIDAMRRLSPAPQSVVVPVEPTEAMLDAVVNRFLGWRLPKDFAPDHFITFDREAAQKLHNRTNGTAWPIGTNLFTADQAREMLRYVLSAAKSGSGE